MVIMGKNLIFPAKSMQRYMEKISNFHTKWKGGSAKMNAVPLCVLSVIQRCILHFFLEATSWIETHNLHRLSSFMPHGMISSFRPLTEQQKKKQIILGGD